MSEEVVKEDDSKFVILIDKDGRVKVDISGPHVNKKTFNRLILAAKKSYRNHIRLYRKQVKRDMTKVELDAIVAEPTSLKLETNGKVVDDLSIIDTDPDTPVSAIGILGGMHQPVESLDTDAATGGTMVEVKPVTKVIEPKKLSLQQVIDAKRAGKLAETKS